MNINEIFNNPNNIYHGHGIGPETMEKIQSILNNGLRCSHGSLYYTSVALGMGQNIDDSVNGLLKKWPHKDSNIIIIISLPNKYRILDSPGIGTYNLGDAAYYYIPSLELQEQFSLTNSPYVMPEFVMGYYDAREDSFTMNSNYYEYLTQDQQDGLFLRIKQNYFNLIQEAIGAREYKKIIEEVNWEFPISEEELELLEKNYNENLLLSKIAPDLLNKKLLTPLGIQIPAIEYLKRYIFPNIPSSGYVVLKNGAKIPMLHFVVECVLYDCQERYNGDFERYFQDNVQEILPELSESLDTDQPKR